MDVKPLASPFAGHEDKVEELRSMARLARRLLIFLFLGALVEAFIFYRLVFTPCTASMRSCAYFCPEPPALDN